MTTQERLDELNVMKVEFENKNTTEERRIELLTKLREFSNEEMPESKCVNCKNTGFYAPYTHALIEGHCYSLAGVKDYTNITQMCEFCFDNLFPPSEE